MKWSLLQIIFTKGYSSPAWKEAFDLFTYHMCFICKICQPVLLQYMSDQVKMRAPVNYQMIMGS